MTNPKAILIATALVGAALTGVYAVFAPTTQAQETTSKSPFSCQIGLLTLQCNILTDSLTINEVIYNRGNCKLVTEQMAQEDLKLTGLYRFDYDFVLQGIGNKLGNFKFGNYFIPVPEKSCNLLEITFRTDHGDWTWRLPLR